MDFRLFLIAGGYYTRENFLEASRLWHSTEIELSIVQRAAFTYISAQQSIVGNMKDFKWLSVDANNRKMVESYYSNLNNLWRVHHGVGKFDVTCEDWFDVLEAYKHRSDVLLFIDPPYDAETCVSKYSHNIEREAHERLVSFLLSDGMRCRVILCGNYSELYTPLENAGWSCIFLDRLQRQASLFTKNKRFADEFIWCNMAL